jgi:phosphoglycolate phosphatase-like HAD superfamily hydrolase
MKPLVLFDIDGTLADISHRRHHVMGENKNWGAFFKHMGDDAPNQPVVDLYKALQVSGLYDLVIVSARPDNNRPVTEQWLVWNGIEFERLIMRPAGDYRPDTEIKKEILDLLRDEGKDIAFVVDDRDCVVDMWRKNGITCLQCAPGDF